MRQIKLCSIFGRSLEAHSCSTNNTCASLQTSALSARWVQPSHGTAHQHCMSHSQEQLPVGSGMGQREILTLPSVIWKEIISDVWIQT